MIKKPTATAGQFVKSIHRFCMYDNRTKNIYLPKRSGINIESKNQENPFINNGITEKSSLWDSLDQQMKKA